MGVEMPASTENINSHVDRLHRFLPFTPAHEQIYEEYQNDKDALDLETVAIEYAQRVIGTGAKLLILTGDAGHGKTHMCRRLLESEHLGYTVEESRRLLLESCDGRTSLPSKTRTIKQAIRIHKDLSEVNPPSRAATLLESAKNTTDEILIVCANEGRLRAIINSESAGAYCESIRELVRNSFKSGVTAVTSGEIHIVNLNHQSVASKISSVNGSLLRRVLKDWVENGRRWPDRSCGTCVHNNECPIRHNRALLTGEGELGQHRISRLEELFEISERLGTVVTIREMLMLVAYLITGGLTCEDIHKRLRQQPTPRGWQYEYAYYNLLFCSPQTLPEERVIKGIPTLAFLRRLDPGLVAIREIDESVLSKGDVFKEGQLDLLFDTGLKDGGADQRVIDAALGIDDFTGSPNSKVERQREFEVTMMAIAGLRRRSFFDAHANTGDSMKRLGFKFGDEFNALLSSETPTQQKLIIKNTLITGLHVIQGLRLSKSETVLHLVDPAFGRAHSDAAIIARSISSASIHLLTATDAWNVKESAWTTPRSVDWIDRNIVLRISETGAQARDLSINLFAFECIGRAARGYISEAFYANELRKIRSFLGNLAEDRVSDPTRIDVFTSGKIQQVSLDQGVIQVGGEA
jgi:hypothetical protein